MSRLTQSWKQQPIAIGILRAWLGITWVYAGWNKANDSGFLTPASPHYIGAQINGFLATSPISGFLRHALEHAQLVGWMTMIGEFAIGIAILSGFAMQLASIAGFLVATSLWLSVTWTVKPYFLGSDTAYMALWAALFFSLRATGKKTQPLVPNLRDRREVLKGGAIAAGAVLVSVVGRLTATTGKNPESGSTITTLANFPVGSTMQFTAKDGSPAVLFRTNSGVFAYSAICTHQGCTVGYDQGQHLLICPCHGAAYDPTKNAAVVAGPAPTPLAKISVAIKGANIVQI
jgi:thiosulfate dehydrogenase (quinone) large subunit